MMKKLRIVSENIKEILNTFKRNKSHKEEQTKIGLQSLTPTSEADDTGVYCGAIEEAVTNENNYNIALTGGYGSGKSSIIETYLQNSHTYSTSKNVLRISLANFNFVSKPSNNKRSGVAGVFVNEYEEQIVLEISIIQQIIFQIKSKKIRRKFRKQFDINWWKSILYALIIFITFIALTFSINPNIFKNWILEEEEFTKVITSKFIYINIVIATLGVITILSFLVGILLRIGLNKFQIKGIEFQLEKKFGYYGINTQIDELIYLLNKSKIELIIFEDLDRFNDYDIFEKLREINHLIKYSPDLNSRSIKFLYVLRESIFETEKEKNKFFDIIIPVIPFISSKNSKTKLLKLFENEKLSIKSNEELNKFNDLIKTCSLCIDEMRTIKNIYNEYKVYLNVIQKNGDDNIDVKKHELLAIIIYKNLFSKDFENINSGISSLDKIFNNREIFQIKLRTEKENAIKVLERELKMLIPEENNEDRKRILEDISTLKNEATNIVNLSFSDILQQIEESKFVPLKIKDFFESSTNNQIKNGNIQEAETNTNETKVQLLISLIKEGFITRDFKHYTSLFHVGELSYLDRKTYFKLKVGEKIDFESPIDNPNFLLEEFTESMWSNFNYLNKTLFDKILENNKYDKKLRFILESDSDKVLNFIHNYTVNTEYINKLSRFIFSYWENFSKKAITSNEFSNEVFDLFLPNLLLNQLKSIIKIQNKDNILTDYISGKESFSHLFPKEKKQLTNPKNNLYEILKFIDVKFNKVNEESRNWVTDIIYGENIYEINTPMILLWSRLYLKEENFIPTYTSIMESSLEKLKSYINDEIFEFTENVLFHLIDDGYDWKEDEVWMKKLLNFDNEILDNETKSIIIENVQLSDFNLEDYSEDLWGEIVFNEKMRCDWNNLIKYYKKNGIDTEFLKLISKKKWIENLDNYEEESEILTDQIVGDFLMRLFEKNISDFSLITIVNKYNYYLNSSIITSETNMLNIEILINQRAFDPQDVVNIYNVLKSLFRNNLIHIKFIEEYQNDILKLDDLTPFFKDLTRDEIMFIINKPFLKDFIILMFSLLDYFEAIQFNDKEFRQLKNIVQIAEFTNNIPFLIYILKALSPSEQPSFYVWLYENNVISRSSPNKYLDKFKGDLSYLHLTQCKNIIKWNSINKKFSDTLVSLGMINRYKVNKEKKSISFYRNTVSNN